MRFDVRIHPSNRMRADADLIRRAEDLGFAGAWVTERGRNPFFSLTIAAKETGAIKLGAQSLAAFPRSPMVTAQIAWDLARQSSGRFRLGLEAPNDPGDGAARMREYIESLRAIWHTFQTDARLRYRGEYYTFRLMAPFFNPGPIEHPNIPIYLAGMNPAIAELAGRLCQGLHVDAFHSVDYIRKALKPAVAAGLQAAGRADGDFSLAVPALVGSGVDDAGIRQARLAMKHRIASAANSAEFRRLVARHDWDISADELDQLTQNGHIAALDRLIPDEIVDEIAIVAPPHDVIGRIKARYEGLVDRVSLDLSGENGDLIEAIMTGR